MHFFFICAESAVAINQWNVSTSKLGRGAKIELPNQLATEALAENVAAELRRGDVIALTGDLGAGKSVFARALIKARGLGMGVEIGMVPGPTFTIVQQYEFPDFPVYHFPIFTGFLNPMKHGKLDLRRPLPKVRY